MEKETLIDKLNVIITKAGTAIIMNLMFVLCCIPIVTIGQAWCGLMSAIRYNIRGEGWFAGFKKGFRTRFLRGTISWCVMLAIIVLSIVDIRQYTLTSVSTVYPISSIVIFALMAMMAMSLLVLNVYIHTSVGNWINNAAKLVFRAPLQLLVCAAAAWLPVLMLIFWPDWAYFLIMVFVVVYFTLVALATTILMKDPLVEFLVEARMEGTLLSEEGKTPEPKEGADGVDGEYEENGSDEEEEIHETESAEE